MIRRYAHISVLTKADIPYPVETVHNAAVVKHENEYIMLFRSQFAHGPFHHRCLARSPTGSLQGRPPAFLTPSGAYEEFGVEDPRVTFLDGEYLITYQRLLAQWGPESPWQRPRLQPREGFALITEADYRNVVIFPEKFDNLYAGWTVPFGNRPLVDLGFPIPRSAFWGESNSSCALNPITGRNEDWSRRAAIKTDPGWLSIYHGVFQTNGRIGSTALGVALP